MFVAILHEWAKCYFGRLWLIRSEIKITGSTPADVNTENVEMTVPLKHLINL